MPAITWSRTRLPAPTVGTHRGERAKRPGSPTIAEAVSLFCQGAQKAATRRSYRTALSPLVALCSGNGVARCSELTPQVVASLPASLCMSAPATRRHRLVVARGFLNWAGAAGWCDPSCAAVLRPGRPLAPARGAAWSLREVERVLSAGGTWRDRALLWSLASTGARIAEVVGARVSDFDGGTLVITGKTGTRGVPLCPEARRAVIWYLRHRRALDGSGPLFMSRQGQLSERRAREIVYAACRRAGVARRGPHALRHAAAARWLRAGVPLVVVAEALGHSRPSTTIDHYSTVVAGDLARGLSADPLWGDEAMIDRPPTLAVPA